MNPTTEIRELSADEIDTVSGAKGTTLNFGGVFEIHIGKGVVTMQVGDPNHNNGAGIGIYQGGHVSGYVGNYTGHA